MAVKPSNVMYRFKCLVKVSGNCCERTLDIAVIK